MDPKLMEQFKAFQAFMAMQQGGAAPEAQPSTPEAKVAAHLQAKQAKDQDGEVVSQAAAKVAAQQKVTGPTIKAVSRAAQATDLIRGTDGGLDAPVSDFPISMTLHFADKDDVKLQFNAPSVSSNGKPGVYAVGTAPGSVPGLSYQVGCNFTRRKLKGSK